MLLASKIQGLLTNSRKRLVAVLTGDPIPNRLTDLASNCYCRPSALNMPMRGGYLDFDG